MEIQINNLINQTKARIFINSKDTVYDLKKLISSYMKKREITESNVCLYYKDSKTNQICYMLSPYRAVLSYNEVYYTKEIFVEQIGVQLDSGIAIIVENIIPIITIYYLYNKENYYTKLLIHRIIFLLSCLYFISRLFNCLHEFKT